MSDQIIDQMTHEEFFAYVALHPDKHFDFMDGEVVEVSPKPVHGYIQAKLASILDLWLESTQSGYVFTEVLHVLNGKRFMPDVSINHDLAMDQSHFDSPPLLAVEIRSDSQSRVAQRRKALDYIERGTPAVLLIMPGEQIELFTQDTGDDPIVFTSGEVVENIPGLDGLKIDTKRLFRKAT